MKTRQKRSFRYKLCKLYLMITRMILSFKSINRCQIGTRVIIIPTKTVGVCVTGSFSFNPTKGEKSPSMHWKVRNPLVGNMVVMDSIPEKQLKKIFCLTNLKYGLFSWWRWYKTSWLDIDASAMNRREPLRSVEILGSRLAYNGKMRA